METIGDAVEALARELEWTDEASALGGVDCGYDDDDSRGWLAMGDGLVRVEWLRDPYGDGADDWVAVNLEVSDEPYDERLPEDEADVHAMAREAYEWVKAVAE